MKYFMVEGILTSTEPIEDAIMESHIKYSKKAMEEGLILMSGLKEDMSGVLLLMKAETKTAIEEYLEKEPFRLHGLQEYRTMEFTPHYIKEDGFGMSTEA